ncbi:hypothetical protein DUNSADRAFT_17743 [Dunaliella salina]|uniref:Uncharacterized protein n=1 Tax=Dunaliella salina TaxID=3046 RepID=A0ABQ7G182_DUNSA|nr:hypothetical protein DUNSADRAFT_17743 [Dunaliella salina]|eukprot:KAF5828360.1 hypothetical protein DUNSADRAFT_17743 [Dunaliella salina]
MLSWLWKERTRNEPSNMDLADLVKVLVKRNEGGDARQHLDLGDHDHDHETSMQLPPRPPDLPPNPPATSASPESPRPATAEVTLASQAFAPSGNNTAAGSNEPAERRTPTTQGKLSPHAGFSLHAPKLHDSGHLKTTHQVERALHKARSQNLEKLDDSPFAPSLPGSRPLLSLLKSASLSGKLSGRLSASGDLAMPRTSAHQLFGKVGSLSGKLSDRPGASSNMATPCAAPDSRSPTLLPEEAHVALEQAAQHTGTMLPQVVVRPEHAKKKSNPFEALIDSARSLTSVANNSLGNSPPSDGRASGISPVPTGTLERQKLEPHDLEAGRGSGRVADPGLTSPNASPYPPGGSPQHAPTFIGASPASCGRDHGARQAELAASPATPPQQHQQHGEDRADIVVAAGSRVAAVLAKQQAEDKEIEVQQLRELRSLFGVYGVPNSLKASALPPIAKQRLQQLTQAQQQQQQQQGSAAGTSSSTTDAASSRSKEHSSSVHDPAQQFMQEEVVNPSSVSLSLPSPLSLRTDSQGASEVITRAHDVTAQAHNQGGSFADYMALVEGLAQLTMSCMHSLEEVQAASRTCQRTIRFIQSKAKAAKSGTYE